MGQLLFDVYNEVNIVFFVAEFDLKFTQEISLTTLVLGRLSELPHFV